jgi:hypothetical protein
MVLLSRVAGFIDAIRTARGWLLAQLLLYA